MQILVQWIWVGLGLWVLTERRLRTLLSAIDSEADFSVHTLFLNFLPVIQRFDYLKEKDNFYIFINLFLAALGLRCCARAFSSCREWGLLFVAVRGLLIAVASLVAEHGL